MKKATKVRIYSTDEQAAFINAQLGETLFTYKTLQLKCHMYQHHGVPLSSNLYLKPLVVVARKSRKYDWLKEFYSLALQQAVINMDKAFTNVFKLKARVPTFKSKRGWQSNYHHPNEKVQDKAIQLPKITPIRAVIHRDIISVVSSIIASCSPTGKYYASTLCEDGCDIEFSHYLIESSGKNLANPRHLINSSSNLRRKQKALSLKKNGCVNRGKVRRQLAAQHKLSYTMVDDSQAIIVETLNEKLQTCLRHWRWWLDRIYQQARAQYCCGGCSLGQAESVACQLEICHCCGHKMSDISLYQRYWQRPDCNRDVNATMNIQQKGILELKAAGHVVSVQGCQRKSVHLNGCSLRGRKPLRLRQ